MIGMISSPRLLDLIIFIALCIPLNSFTCKPTSLFAKFVLSSSIKESPDVPTLKGVKTKINTIVQTDDILSVRLKHILLASKDLAEECREMIKTGKAEFSDMARSLSMCVSTKEIGGDVGWISLEEKYDAILPRNVVDVAIRLNKGDIVIVRSSETNWHIVQLMDVHTVMKTNLLKRRAENYLAMKGLSSVDEDHSSPSLTYSMETMGCQMNFADSERIEGQLQDLGYIRVEDSATASLVVLNTCSIREHAEQKVYSYIGPHAMRKRKGEDVSIVVTGCVAQQEGELLTRRFPEVDVVMGPQYSNRVADVLEAVADGYQVVVTDPTYQSEDALLPARRSSVCAWVNIVYGCNERCTYCVVPTTRGVEQSRTKEAVLEEIRQLVADGYKEVTLLGQNIDAWGRDMNPKQRFADLLSAVAEVPGIGRVRFLTSHPKYMSERVIAAVAANPVLAPNFNVPFQSGDDEVLKNMRRGYTRERYLEIVGNIRRHLPDASLTADVIVGFPGETEEQFENTLRLMREVEFDMLNTAAYSPRPNTPAALWESLQLDDVVKQDRLQRINRLATEHALRRSERFLGRVQSVLVEDINPKRPGQVMGRNEHNRIVFFEGDIAELKGKFVSVQISEVRPYSLTGKQCKQ